MRLIDADALLDFIHNGQGKEWFNSTSNRLTASDCVNAQPTIEAVEVVRCENCVHSREIKGSPKKWYFTDRVMHCAELRGSASDDGISAVWRNGYCDDGERKEGT